MQLKKKKGQKPKLFLRPRSLIPPPPANYSWRQTAAVTVNFRYVTRPPESSAVIPERNRKRGHAPSPRSTQLGFVDQIRRGSTMMAIFPRFCFGDSLLGSVKAPGPSMSAEQLGHRPGSSHVQITCKVTHSDIA